MSGPEEPREPAEEAGTPPVPASPAPPSFGQADGPADAIGFSPFGLEKPWWAAAETEEPEPSINISRTEEPETAPPTFDTLVAGVGVPSVDTRRAVPAEPIVQRPSQTFSDTDPDGIPVITPSTGEPADTDEAPGTAKTDLPSDVPSASQAKETGMAPTVGEPPNAGVAATNDHENVATGTDKLVATGVATTTGEPPNTGAPTNPGATASASEATSTTTTGHANEATGIGIADALGVPPNTDEAPGTDKTDHSWDVSSASEPADTGTPTGTSQPTSTGTTASTAATEHTHNTTTIGKPPDTGRTTDTDTAPATGTPPDAGRAASLGEAASTAAVDHASEATRAGRPTDVGEAANTGTAATTSGPPDAGRAVGFGEAASKAATDHADEATDVGEAANRGASADAGVSADTDVAGVGHAGEADGRVEGGEPRFMAAPVLVPDAILPAGIAPPTDSSVVPVQPEAEAEEQAGPTIITPVYHAEGGQSIDAEDSPAEQGFPLGFGPDDRPASRGNRKALLIVGAVAGALLATAATFAVIGGTSDDSKTAASPSPSRAAVKPSPVVPPAPPPVDISSEKTDPQPLALAEAYPSGAVDLGGRAYVRDRSSVNHRCSLAARGVMADALTREGCRSVVRVTYLDRGKALAVTTGIAAMPDKDAALKASKAGSPSRYEWFRGMAGRRSQSIDQAGGFAVSTVRGRYIIYAYAQYADGKRAQPDDQTLKTAAQQFVDYSVRPIDARAT
ncbi:hypothetical protein [Actinomadura rudentiformis]|uniref:Uncharacterized protein n=1 Tax=Actinomadura rudentiformis TaxID=359158 RepID=A0A6H9YU44_9ACTN|nr:hypothetical protein [Actinomadura rudentiformis]KAB2351804.1 hypothetical protein F8566_06240 [Actinomadura rudentiformis]